MLAMLGANAARTLATHAITAIPVVVEAVADKVVAVAAKDAVLAMAMPAAMLLKRTLLKPTLLKLKMRTLLTPMSTNRWRLTLMKNLLGPMPKCTSLPSMKSHRRPATCLWKTNNLQT